jgi:hypothetical protein
MAPERQLAAVKISAKTHLAIVHFWENALSRSKFVN